MHIRELFASDVTRDIPPVVYLYEQSPEKLADEVGEYIVTGGWPKDHPHHRRVPNGIHEQFVRLLSSIKRELDGRDDGSMPGACSLPASWISGFYGSGKSSFAKLLGLSLADLELPDGRPLHEALLARDTSPRAPEFREAWDALSGSLDRPVAVVFDVGAVARDNEHIHSAVVRRVQLALGYCSTQALVAEFELKLERDGQWDRFEEVAAAELGSSWSTLKDTQMAEEDFSQVMAALFPDRYLDPMAWFESRAGTSTLQLSPDEAVQSVAEMMRIRAPGRDLVIVVDEVSQYIHQDSERMLRLQSFVEALGARMKGRAWLFCTGQEKLDAQNSATVLGKLKDRFPERFRVHLAATNIRDVVHRRLLQKTPEGDRHLRELFAAHRTDLKLFAFGCEAVTEDDFVEVYPMLPGHIDLLLQITSALRTRSSRSQGDDHAIRGLLQLLGELFRAQDLANLPVGELVTLDRIYEVQQTALDSDVQATLARIFKYCSDNDDPLAERAAKAVALLELLNETQPVDVALIASCLYDRMDVGDRTSAVRDALERLRVKNLLGYSEKLGYKVQSSAGQEWEKERQDIGVPTETVSELVQEALSYLLGGPDRPRLQGRPFPWSAFFSDGRRFSDHVLQDARDPAAVVVDVRYLPASDQSRASWVKRSDETALRDRIVWVTGDPGQVADLCRQLARSRRMVQRYTPRKESLTPAKRVLLQEESNRSEDLDGKVRKAVDAALMAGRIYFRARDTDPRELGGAFGPALYRIGTQVLPELFPRFTATNVTPGELLRLLDKELTGPSPKFLPADLGILELDAGRYVPTCAGQVPSRVLAKIEEEKGLSGASLLSFFGKPPYGYPSSVVRACLAGLLRAGKVRLRPDDGLEVTSVRDAGVRDLFEKERGLSRADVFPAGESEIGPRDRARICRFFDERLGHAMDRENDAIADAVFQHFPVQATRLRSVEERLNRLPGPPPTPKSLEALRKALEDCRRSRQVLPTVKEVKKHLDRLNDGVQQLSKLHAELTDAAISQVDGLSRAAQYPLAQLKDMGLLPGELSEAADRLEEQLASPVPWRGAPALERDAEDLWAAYRSARGRLLERQEQLAEQARGRVRSRPGFGKLTGDQSHQVLRPITEALVDTTTEAVAPTLRALHAGMERRISDAEDTANERLDAFLSSGDDPVVVKVALGLRNREIAGESDLDALLDEIRERITSQLAEGRRIRLV